MEDVHRLTADQEDRIVSCVLDPISAHGGMREDLTKTLGRDPGSTALSKRPIAIFSRSAWRGRAAPAQMLVEAPMWTVPDEVASYFAAQGAMKT